MSTNNASGSASETAASSSNATAVSNDDIEKMVRLCLGGEIVQVPQSLAASEDVFRAVMTKETFDGLTPDAKTYLKRFLPTSDGTDESEDKILRGAFTSDKNFYFGNALGKVHSKIREQLVFGLDMLYKKAERSAGWFNPERPSDQVQLRDNARVLYDHYIRRYYITLLKKLLISRRQLVEVAAKVPADDPIIQDRAPDIRDLKRFSKSKKLQERAAKRARFIISECKQQVGEYGLSSDDEADPTAAKTPVTASGEGTLLTTHTTDIQMHQPLYLSDVKDLVREYRILKEVEPDSPSLDFSDVRLDEVYDRAGLPFAGERQTGGSKAKPSKLAAPVTPRAKSPANSKPPA